VPSGQSVATLLEWLQIGSDRVAVELDKAIVRKRDWEQTAVRSGSHIEIVEFVGGG
jgi:thiamine biosynthesis protein ThiS